MAKFHGVIGYVESQEVRPSTWKNVVTERPYYGDLVKNYSKREAGESVIDNIVISNNIDIIADPYANQHFYAIKYVKFNIPNIAGVWSVRSVDVNYPRLTLTLGGVYNGDTA